MSCCKTLFHICHGLPHCTEVLKLKTPILNDSATVIIKDKFNNNYAITKETIAGYIDIYLVDQDEDTPADLPKALLNEFAGDFIFTVKNEGGELVKYSINGCEYDGLVIHVENYSPTETTVTFNPYSMDGFKGIFEF